MRIISAGANKLYYYGYLLFLSSSVSSAFFLKDLLSPQKINNGNNKINSNINNVLLPELDNLIVASNNGLDKSYETNIKEKMIEISKLNGDDQRKSLSGRWELIYTTEKEINFFKTSLWPFANVSSITQNLDLYDTQKINNIIEFEGGGQFIVAGTCTAVLENENENENNDSKKNDNDNGNVEDEQYDRVAFEFTGATAIVWDKEINLPPIGAGWFDTMFCNDEYRLSNDSRQDWSVFRRIE
ncbi:MAG: hypothetical protein ACI8RD_003320 [Bacillariaceae sp.]|jgi:hypothetical protein